MRTEEGSDSVAASDVAPPINLRSIKKEKLTLFVAEQAPLSVDELTEHCIQPRIKSILTTRFATEINIDSEKRISLSKEAQRAVLDGVKSDLQDGRESIRQGQSLVRENHVEEAIPHFEDAVSTLQSVQDRFGAVDHGIEQLDRILATAKQRHDSMKIKVTKNSINHHLRQANQRESDGDEQYGNNPKAAEERYRAAKDAISAAMDEATEYNESRFDPDSPTLSLDPLQENFQHIESKRQKADRAVSSSSRSGESISGQKEVNSTTQDATTGSDSPSRTDLLKEIKDLAAQLGRKPSDTDMQQAGKYDLAEYFDVFQTWEEVLRQADTDFPSDQELIAELRRVAAESEGEVTPSEMDASGEYSSAYVVNAFGSWTDAMKASGLHAQGNQFPSTGTDQDTEPGTGSGELAVDADSDSNDSESKTRASKTQDESSETDDEILDNIMSDFDDI
jgi:hypothetical protein